jgi:hypothetical protein
MSKEEKVTIFELNKPNLNGRIYTTECMTKAIDELDGKPLSGCIGMVMGDVNLKDISHQVSNLHIEGDKVLGTLHILDTPNGIALRQRLEVDKDSIAYRSSGYGNIEQQEDGTYLVIDYHLTSINVVNKDTAA